MEKKLTFEEFLKSRNNTSIQPSDCPVTFVFNILQGKWKNHVLFEMSKYKSIRFGELKKALSPITNTMLTSTLKELEEDGLLSREQFNEIPPHVEYALTKKSVDLLPIFYEMHLWGIKYINK